MNKFIIIMICVVSPKIALGYTFSDAVISIERHDAVISISNNSKALVEEGGIKGSWGDPMFRVAAKNFPNETMKDDQTPMTGIEFGLTQKISLTTKYGNIEDAFSLMGESKEHQAKDKKNELIKKLWLILINDRRLTEEILIIKENINWISNILKVSKKLYATGKITQQALLEIQIRKSELETSLSNKVFDQETLQQKLSYVLGFSGKSISKNSVPWKLLESDNKNKIDNKELSLKSLVGAKEKMLTAQKLNYVPDLTFSVGYTKRANIDNNGDFVSAMVSFPLPLSGKKYSAHNKASFDKYESIKNLENYKKFKLSKHETLLSLIRKSQTELNILKERTIKFAENSRKITSKSYSLGNSTYVELLQSELKLQSLLIRRAVVFSSLYTHKVNLKYLIGEKLHE